MLKTEYNRRIIARCNELKGVYKHDRLIFNRVGWEFCRSPRTIKDIYFSTEVRKEIKEYEESGEYDKMVRKFGEPKSQWSVAH